MQKIRQQEDGTWHATYAGLSRVFVKKKQAKNWCGRQARNLRKRESGDYAVLINRHAVRTCVEVGKILGISKSRVQQIENVALAKLRAMLIADGTKDEVFGAVR